MVIVSPTKDIFQVLLIYKAFMMLMLQGNFQIKIRE